MTILGRTIEHLGTQMYKHRAPSIAELIANCWDAGATSTWINVPLADQYDLTKSSVQIIDNGEGMDTSSIQDRYLVVGRNRRAEGGAEKYGRKVMGRKGIGKLAGFGLADNVTVTTWVQAGKTAIRFSMSLDQLKGVAGKAHEIVFPWDEVGKDPAWPASGTMIELSGLRHATPIDINILMETLSRRFSRTTRGQMQIHINGSPLTEPSIGSISAFPSDGTQYGEAILPGGKKVLYRYIFSQKTIRSKELQGFVIYANERTAQAPPFFFNVESTASAQHSTRYVSGEIIADFLDAGVDDESDVISTDRQELDWESEELKELQEWGKEFTRKVLRECSDMRGSQLENWILSDKGFSERLELLEPPTRKEISRFLKILGQKTEENDERTRDLADSLIKAYEFRGFHDVIDDIERASQNPEALEEILSRLHDWKVLESRALLEIVEGRLSIISKLEQMIVHDAPETASGKTHDNLHDLLAEYPWLFNPEWQVFTEEKTISAQLREFGEKHCSEDMKAKRVDFLAFARDPNELVIIELKRPAHAVELGELQRLEEYQVALMRARNNCRRVLVYGGSVNIPEAKWNEMRSANDFEALTWGEMFTRAKSFYSHYQSVLAGDVSSKGFSEKKVEVARTRAVLETASAKRSPEDRKRGVGSSQA